MKAAAKRHEWIKFLKFFSEQNAGRMTRLGVFERDKDVVTDYWLESGLPLRGVGLDIGDGHPTIQITVGNFTHQVIDPLKLVFQFSRNGDEDGIDISAADGRTTVLRFEQETREH